MRREWSPEELIESWTLVGQDWPLVRNKFGATRLGFALVLKFFEIEARFPHGAEEFPDAPVSYVAEQVNVATAVFAAYSWSDRSITYRVLLQGGIWSDTPALAVPHARHSRA